MIQQPYVIVLANGLNGLGAVRSAAHAGLRTYTLLTSEADLSAYSRYSQYRFMLPPAPGLDDIRPVLDQLYRNEGGPGVLLACSDHAAELLGKLKSEGYSHHYLIVPSAETTEILNDKKLECRSMEEGGITLPRTYYELEHVVPEEFPLIIKPRTFREYSVLGAKNVIVNSISELNEFRQRFQGKLDRFIAQQVIEGNDENLWVCNVTFDKNKNLVACFIFNRLGTMPSHYGVTSLAISRENHVLRQECEKIGKAINYSGPAMIEFKKDEGSGRYYYIETNPRLGMCNWFDTLCGVNNILACANVAYDKPLLIEQQKNNRVYWNFFGDLIARLEDRERLVSIFARYLRLIRYRRVAALLYWRDPHPALRYSYMAIVDIASRVAQRVRKYRRN